MSEQPTVERREVYYSGRVQGVGFRYTARMLAARFPVSGFVKNLANGSVKLVAEGAAEDLDRFLRAVDAEMGYYISRKDEQTSPATGGFRGFDIQF